MTDAPPPIQIDPQAQVRWLLEAGAVGRCHTLPHHGSYDVAQHSWNALVLLYVLHPAPTTSLIWALAFHDMGERFFGDQPGQVRWADKALRELQDAAEAKALHKLGVFVPLIDDEPAWLNGIDRLELLIWCESQIALGNRHVENCRNLLADWFRDNDAELPALLTRFLRGYEWKRGEELL